MLRSVAISAVLLSIVPMSTPALGKESPAKPVDPAADINKPQPGARRIAFSTNQGTWTSLDVSPDGKTIVFDLLGDLYTVPIAGGAAQRITSGPAFDAFPRYSPDGKEIAFTSDRSGIDNLWILDSAGTQPAKPRAVTDEKDAYVRVADWTPDGQFLIARREDGKLAGIPPVEMFVYSRHGGSGVKLTNSDDTHNASGGVASADGRFLYFARRQRPFNYIPNLQDGLWQIARHDRVTGEVAQLTGGFGGAARPALSPDGRLLAYISRRDGETVLVLRELTDGSERILARGLGKDEMEGFAAGDLYPGYSFTPDGTAIVLSDRGRLARLELATGTRSEIPFTAPVEQWAAPRVAWQSGVDDGDVALKVLRRPSMTADGGAIVFEALGRLWRQKVEAGKAVGAPVRLTTDGADSTNLLAREYGPTISADGAWVAFVSWSDRELGHVWKIPVAGGVPTRLTKVAAHYANPTWSPAGDKLLILRGSGLELRGRQPEEDGSFEAHVLDVAAASTSPAETRYVATIAVGAGQVYHPFASFLIDESGERIVYALPVPGKKPTEETKTDLVSVRLDGSDRKVHLRLPVASEISPSPDGLWVAFTSRDTVYLGAWAPTKTAEPVELALTGGPLPVVRLSEAAGAFLGWTDGGKSLTWGLGNTFHRIAIARALEFVAAEKEKAAAKAITAEKESKKKGEDKAEAEKEPDLKLPKADTIRIALEAPRFQPKGSFVLKNARVVTMRGDEVLPSADVLVTDNRIAAVGAAGSLAIPQGTASFDAAGTTIVPGLIDTHAHLHYSAFEVFPETKWEYLANLAYGVTTTYDPSAPTIDVFAQAEMIEAGRMLGPRVYSSGMVLYGGQHTDIWSAVDDLEDARRQVKRMQAWGASMIKVYQQPRRAQRRWFAQAAREEKMLVTAEGGGELFADLTMAMDGFTAFEHSLPVELGDDVARFLGATGTHYTPTLLVSYGGPWGELYYWQTQNPHDDPKLNRFTPHFALDNWGRRHPWVTPGEYHFPLVAEGVAKVARAGGNVSLGAHGQLQGLGVHWELWSMAGENARPGHGALTNHEALHAATDRAAEKLGLLPDLGTIEKGKLADLLVLDADPLADIHNSEKIRWVIKNGELYEASTMKRLWPSVLEQPKQYWQAAGD